MPTPAMRQKSIMLLRQTCEHWKELARAWREQGNPVEVSHALSRLRECEQELETLLSSDPVDGPRPGGSPPPSTKAQGSGVPTA